MEGPAPPPADIVEADGVVVRQECAMTSPSPVVLHPSSALRTQFQAEKEPQAPQAAPDLVLIPPSGALSSNIQVFHAGRNIMCILSRVRPEDFHPCRVALFLCPVIPTEHIRVTSEGRGMKDILGNQYFPSLINDVNAPFDNHGWKERSFQTSYVQTKRPPAVFTITHTRQSPDHPDLVDIDIVIRLGWCTGYARNSDLLFVGVLSADGSYGVLSEAIRTTRRKPPHINQLPKYIKLSISDKIAKMMEDSSVTSYLSGDPVPFVYSKEKISSRLLPFDAQEDGEDGVPGPPITTATTTSSSTAKRARKPSLCDVPVRVKNTANPDRRPSFKINPTTLTTASSSSSSVDTSPSIMTSHPQLPSSMTSFSRTNNSSSDRAVLSPPFPPLFPPGMTGPPGYPASMSTTGPLSASSSAFRSVPMSGGDMLSFTPPLHPPLYLFQSSAPFGDAGSNGNPTPWAITTKPNASSSGDAPEEGVSASGGDPTGASAQSLELQNMYYRYMVAQQYAFLAQQQQQQQQQQQMQQMQQQQQQQGSQHSEMNSQTTVTPALRVGDNANTWRWTPQTDRQLIEAVTSHGVDWHAIASHFPAESLEGVRNRWRHLEAKISRKLKNPVMSLQRKRGFQELAELHLEHMEAVSASVPPDEDRGNGAPAWKRPNREVSADVLSLLADLAAGDSPSFPEEETLTEVHPLGTES